MSEIESNEKIKTDVKVSLCYYCGIEIKSIALKRCPNCKVILDPNNYINWRNSFFGFLCLLFLIPILIAIIISIFYI
ncbi:MAG: hypothetical protein ACFFDO_02790 [Candidatus Thorarchaeota archaeon]